MVLYTLYGRSFDTNELAGLAFLHVSIFIQSLKASPIVYFLNLEFDQEYIIQGINVRISLIL